MAFRVQSIRMSSASKDMKSAIEAKCREILKTLLLQDENKVCADCLSKGPRWASWNLGVYLCIRCAGLHRKLGVHISKVKSVDLDSWTPDQVSCMEQMGNSRARESYEAKLDPGFQRPQTDSSLEFFIREKYEGLRYARDGFHFPKAAERIEWLEDLLAGKSNKRKQCGPSETFIPTLAKPPGFTGTPRNEKSKMGAVEPQPLTNDLLGLDAMPETTPVLPGQHKEDLATLLGGDLAPLQSPSQVSNESILALYNVQPSVANTASSGAFFRN